MSRDINSYVEGVNDGYEYSRVGQITPLLKKIEAYFIADSVTQLKLYDEASKAIVETMRLIEE
jgi:hypothetical protein